MSAKKIFRQLNEFTQSYGFENEEQEKASDKRHSICGTWHTLTPQNKRVWFSCNACTNIEAFMVHIADLISARAQMFDMATHIEQNFYLNKMIIKE